MNGIDFVYRIDNELAKKNISRVKMSEDIGLPKHLVAQWKQRGTIPSADIAFKIAQYLGTTVEYLVTGTESNEYKNKYDYLKSSMQKLLEES